MTGRGGAACALYAGFLASWALGAKLRRRGPGPYLVLGLALLEATLAIGAAVALASLGSAPEPPVHAAYLLASVLLLPLGLVLSRTPDGHLDGAPLAVTLLALAVVIVRVEATA